MRWRRISPPTLISTACLHWRDENTYAKRGKDRDQHRVGAAIEGQGTDNVGGVRVTPSAAHDSVLDAHAAVDPRTGERQAERSRHGRLGVARIGRTVAGG